MKIPKKLLGADPAVWRAFQIGVQLVLRDRAIERARRTTDNSRRFYMEHARHRNHLIVRYLKAL